VHQSSIVLVFGNFLTESRNQLGIMLDLNLNLETVVSCVKAIRIEGAFVKPASTIFA